MVATTEWLDKDYYEVLGVDESASDAEIRKAHRTLAREAHPDASPGDADAEARFKEISAAYDVIGDPHKRKEYDEVRRLGTAGAGPGGFRVHVDNLEDFNGFSSSGFNDIFGDLFGRRSSRRRTTSARPRARLEANQ